MSEPYISLISGFIGAIIGAGASLLAVWLQSRHCLSQQTWSNREKYYMNLLSSLTSLRASLEDRSDYYMEPGSEHDQQVEKDERFVHLSQIGADSLRAIRGQLGPASVFLSTDAVQSVEQLIREHWHAVESSICTAEYVQSALELANSAYSAVLTEARNDLAKVKRA